ncbi:MAG TPA: hypothetical protein VFE50_15260 [Cyclobacteriaceae bacterium]|nr:hypothetical protein [Cyclobacteriaceae bacterium]
MMYDKRKFFAGLAVIFGVALILPIYFLVLQINEDRVVDRYLAEHNLDNLPVSKSTAVTIAKQVESDFNVDPSTFQHLKMDNRPFLREDAGFLLTCKEGLCGEGARVIVRLLNARGFDATRVTLYDRYMQFAHTVVSVQLGNDRFWIDTINSKDSLTNLLETENISENNFQYLDYSDKISQRLDKIEQHRSVDETVEFQKNMGEYFLYSFESIPYTKLLSKVGIQKRVFNLKRPPHFISVLAEKPNMIKFWASLTGALALTLICVKPVRRYFRKPQ